MSATIAVVQTSAVGVGVAVDIVGTSAFQQVKLVGGQVGATTSIDATAGQPAAGSVGLVVALRDGASVTIQQGVSVSAQVSGTITVNTAATVAGASVTIQQGASVSAVVSGTVSVSGFSVTTAGPSVSATGAQVWVVGGQSSTAFPIFVSQINPPAAGGGSVTTAPPSISQSGQAMWIVGGQSTTAFPVVVTGTVSAGAGTTVVSIQNIVGVTTAASVSVTGLPVWLNPTQQVVVSGLAGHSVTGTVSLLNIAPVTTAASVSVTGLPVWLNPTQAVVVNTAATIAGASVTIQQGASITGTVSLLSIVGVTTAASVSVTGLPVWLNPTQQVVVSGLAGHSVTGTVSILNIVGVTTQASVSVTGLPVWLNPTQAVNVGSIASTVNVAIVAGAGGGGSVTTAPPSISASGQQFWVVGGQSTTAFPVVVTGTVTAGAGTTVVSIQNIVGVTTAASVSVTGLPVWLNPSQTIQVSGNVAAVTTQSNATGAAMWLCPTQTIMVDIMNISVSTTTGLPAVASTGMIVVPKDFARQPVLIMVTSTAIAVSANFYLMTIWTNGTVAAAATTAWPVPAGKVFRAGVLQAAMTTSAVVGGTVQFIVVAATATASMISASFRTQGFQMLGQGIVTALPVQIGPMFAEADTPAATTIGVAIVASTACVLQNVIVQGYLF